MVRDNKGQLHDGAHHSRETRISARGTAWYLPPGYTPLIRSTCILLWRHGLAWLGALAAAVDVAYLVVLWVSPSKSMHNIYVLVEVVNPLLAVALFGILADTEDRIGFRELVMSTPVPPMYITVIKWVGALLVVGVCELVSLLTLKASYVPFSLLQVLAIGAGPFAALLTLAVLLYGITARGTIAIFATCTCSLCFALAGVVYQPLRVAKWYIYTLPFVQSLWEIENWATNRWVLLAMSALLACAAVTVMRLRRTV